MEAEGECVEEEEEEEEEEVSKSSLFRISSVLLISRFPSCCVSWNLTRTLSLSNRSRFTADLEKFSLDPEFRGNIGWFLVGGERRREEGVKTRNVMESDSTGTREREWGIEGGMREVGRGKMRLGIRSFRR